MSITLAEEDLKKDPNDLFTILGKLGEGSYGSVHKALYIPTSTICAIKMVPIDGDSGGGGTGAEGGGLVDE
ncbi:Serine/threonine-protein kinase 4, partial [Borealophlyctis nickersoniae]